MHTKRTCITCTAKGVNKMEIPLWSKKDGLYSILPKVLNCEDKYNPSKQELEEEIPKIVGTKLEVPLEIKEKDRWTFYWATETGSDINGDKPEDPATSYGTESNRGLTKTDKDGNATLVLNCPKLYREDGQLYPRHVHYTVLTEDDVWSTKIGTLEIMCKLPYEIMEKIVKNKSYLIMDALSKESYDEQHIPNSILCHHESLDGLTKQKKDNIIKQLIKENLSDFPKVKDFFDKTDSIKEVPIIVYCSHDECDASAKLSKHLYDCGYYNVLEYPGGLKEWFSGSKGDDLFDDAKSDEGNVDLDTEFIDKEETIVYDGIKYIHKLSGDDDGSGGEIMFKSDMDVIGYYDGEDIEWVSNKEWRNHKERVNAKGGIMLEDDEDDEDDEEGGDDEDDEDEDDEGGDDEDDEEVGDDDEEGGDDDEEGDGEGEGDEEGGDDEEDQESSSSSEESIDELDYNEESLNSETVSGLKELLNKMRLNNKGSRDVLVTRLIECKPVNQDGGGYGDTMIYGGGITQETMNQYHRGWGFTFMG